MYFTIFKSITFDAIFIPRNLRNNSFNGKIPEEIGELKELEVLDLGYNNFSGLIPPQLGTSLSLTIL